MSAFEARLALHRTAYDLGVEGLSDLALVRLAGRSAASLVTLFASYRLGLYHWTLYGPQRLPRES